MKAVKNGFVLEEVSAPQSTRIRKPGDTWDDYLIWGSYLRQYAIGGPLIVSFIAVWTAIEKASSVKKTVMGVHIMAKMHSFDRDNRLEKAEVELSRYAHSSRPNRYSPRWLRAIARELYLHELDEWLLIDGKRRFDPHAKEKQ